VQAKVERYGAPVARSLAFDWNRLAEQYIPGVPIPQSAPQTVTARHEVILSAGAVMTAQILLLSGVGPAEHLRARNITLVADLPVGRHTQDHQELYIMFKYPILYDPGFSFITEIATGFPTLRAHLRGERTFFFVEFEPLWRGRVVERTHW